MAAEIISMAELRNDNRLATPSMILRDMQADIESGELAHITKGVVILLDDEGDGYQPIRLAANMTNAELIALLEVLKAQLLAEMLGTATVDD